MESRITMSHGDGGRESDELIKKIILPFFDSPELNKMNDSAYVRRFGNRVVFTTDSFVVKPLFFSGGDIGKLAVYGTVNDLAVMKAMPKVLSLALILEEGLEISVLKKVLGSVRDAAEDAKIKVVTGDTKVVNKGMVGGMYINTSGIGELVTDKTRKAKAGDAIIVSKSIGEHGLAVMSGRRDLGIKTTLKSDTNNLYPVIKEVIRLVPDAPFMRDATRGGLANTLNELVEKFNLGATIFEGALPIKAEVKSVCESLDIDPLHVSNQGVLVAVVPQNISLKVVEKLRQLLPSKDAAVIGHLNKDFKKAAIMDTIIGGKKIIDKPKGEIIPRIR